MRVTGEIDPKCPFSLQCVTKCTGSQNCLVTETSQNSVAVFGLAKMPLVLDAQPETGDTLNIRKKNQNKNKIIPFFLWSKSSLKIRY